MLLYPLEEPFLLGHEFVQAAPVQRSPGQIAKEGPDQPAGTHAGEGGEAQRDERVESHDTRDSVLDGWVSG